MALSAFYLSVAQRRCEAAVCILMWVNYERKDGRIDKGRATVRNNLQLLFTREVDLHPTPCSEYLILAIFSWYIKFIV